MLRLHLDTILTMSKIWQSVANVWSRGIESWWSWGWTRYDRTDNDKFFVNQKIATIILIYRWSWESVIERGHCSRA